MARRRKLSVISGILLALGVGSAVLAYITAVGSGDGSAAVTTLSSPSPVTATAGIGSAHVTWSSVPSPSGTASEISFTVRRSLNAGAYTTPSGTCAGTLSNATLACDDVITVAGDYTYDVTATFRSWTSVAISNSIAIVVDTTPPTSTITFPVNGTTYLPAAYTAGCTAGTDEVCGTASDSGPVVSGLNKVQVSIRRASDSTYWNGSGWVAAETWNDATGTSSWSYAFAGSNLGDSVVYTVRSRAIDNSSNTQTTPASSSFTFNAAAPTVSSITRVGSSPTNASSVSWTVALSENVSGVGTGDFALASSGLGGTPAITGVTGGPTTYTVTASTGSGSGSLGLNLVDDDSIADGLGAKLGGTGAGNGNFTGDVYTIDRGAPTRTALQFFDTDANGKVDRLVATYSEAVSCVCSGSGGWTLNNVPSGGTLASVSAIGTQVTVVINEGAGAASTAVGSFTAAYAAGAGNVVDLAGNQAATVAATAPTDKAAPARLTMVMQDAGGNGKVDRVVVTFSETLVSTTNTAQWVLANVPSAGSLSSVATASAIATLTLAEGAGAVDTTIGSFTVQLNTNAAGIRDAAGNLSSFTATTPTDGAGPVIVSVATSDGDGKMEAGDTLVLTFSEALAPGSVPSSVTVSESDPSGGGNDTLSIVGILNGAQNTGANNYVNNNNRTASFANSGVALSNADKTVTVTVGTTCSGDCADLAAGGAAAMMFAPATTLTDVAANAGVGSFTTAATFKLF